MSWEREQYYFRNGMLSSCSEIGDGQEDLFMRDYATTGFIKCATKVTTGGYPRKKEKKSTYMQDITCNNPCICNIKLANFQNIHFVLFNFWSTVFSLFSDPSSAPA